jgi:hypothetical protein
MQLQSRPVFEHAYSRRSSVLILYVLAKFLLIDLVARTTNSLAAVPSCLV